MRVAVYGSYSTGTMSTLELVRDYLRSRGEFPNSFLVKDLPDDPRFEGGVEAKSYEAIEKSHCNLFVCTFDGLAQGYTCEILSVPKNMELASSCGIFPEAVYENGRMIRHALSPMLESTMRALGIPIADWQEGDSDELAKLAEGRAKALAHVYTKHRYWEFSR